MISFIEVLMAGNALRIHVTPPATARKWRILRLTGVGVFAGYNDVNAVLVAETTSDVVMDFAGLINGTVYRYQIYYYNGVVWTAGVEKSATPQATYTTQEHDVQEVVLERVRLGLAADIVRGKLPQSEIPTLTAPPLFANTGWPVVTVHLESSVPEVRGLGEILEEGEDEGATWSVGEGWLSRVTLTITGWSINPDERIALRKAIGRIVLANLPVFDDAGMDMVEFGQNDTEEFDRYPAAVYMTVGRFSCLAPTQVRGAVGKITDVTVTYTE